MKSQHKFYLSVLACCFLFFISPLSHPVCAQETVDGISVNPVFEQESQAEEGPDVLLSQVFVPQAWATSTEGDLEKLNGIVDQCFELFGEKVSEQHAALSDFPARGQEKDYQELNDCATVLFIRAEAYMNRGKTDEAVAYFMDIIAKYPWAQAWDPRGWYWSIAEKSQASIDVIQGKRPEEDPEPEPIGLKTMPYLHRPGTHQVIDYTKFGEFFGVGTDDYHYRMDDPAALNKATGEGIYPNTGAILKNPRMKEAKEAGRLEGSHWDFVRSDDMEAALYKWATASEPWGIKLFYMGMIFEKAKMFYEAIKAYHAIVIHFPKTVGWTYWNTPWYPAQAAVAKIKHIIQTHPELDLKMRWMKVEVHNGFDNDISNDIIITYPGVVRKKTFLDKVKGYLHLEKKTIKLGEVQKTVGEGKVQLVQFDNGHWQLFVDGKPFVIKGVTYAPTKIGQSPDKGTLVSWMVEDSNHNGIADGPYEAWVDANKNNVRDPDEPIVGDFQIMKDMGVNTIREYHQPFELNKELLRQMHAEYGFYLAAGDFLGKYTLGSGATWFEGTDYENEEHKANMMESVRKMVMDHKDEPYLLLWILGNENNYGVASNADKKPAAYFKFVNEVAKMIKAIDPDHPIAVCNGDTLFLDIFAENAPDVDIFSANVYRGDYGFGSFWEQVSDAAGIPAFITEFGSPAYAKHLSLDEGEIAQANYHRGNWLDIEANLAGRKNGTGNALGGFVFEWTDEWWKNYEPFYHDRKSDAIGPFPGGYYFEEWFGITSQGNGADSPFMRQLRQSYFAYKDMWRKDFWKN